MSKSTAESYFDAGVAAHKIGLLDVATDRYIATLRIDPDSPDALNNLAGILSDKEQLITAVACVRRALCLRPGTASFLGNLGNILYRMDRFHDGIAAFNAAIEREPKQWAFWHRLGLCYHSLGDMDEAVKCLEEANRLKPGNDTVICDLALSFFAQGAWLKGFKLHQARWQRVRRGVVWDSGIPEWRGQDLTGKTLVVHHEQGFGDTIQFCRLLSEIKAERIVLSVPWQLQRLLRGSELADVVLAADEPVEGDYHCPVMNLPQYVNIEEYLTKPQTSYMRPVAPFPMPLHRGATTHLTIGVCWAGSPQYARDKARSMPFEFVLSLCDIPGVQVFSLQVGDRARDVGKCWANGLISDPTPLVGDFADLAALVEQMDLVVSVDTSVLHLAGAMGKDCVGLIPFTSCWRWLGRERSDTPFYPTMRLVRQTESGDWGGVMTRVRQIVADRIEAIPVYSDAAE